MTKIMKLIVLAIIFIAGFKTAINGSLSEFASNVVTIIKAYSNYILEIASNLMELLNG